MNKDIINKTRAIANNILAFSVVPKGVTQTIAAKYIANINPKKVAKERANP